MSNPRVLIVEDNNGVRQALEFKLRSAGYEVVGVACGSAALQAASEQKPDLMILELHLDADPLDSMRDGFILLGWLRRTLPDSNFPVIVHTGDASPQVDAQAKAEGVYAVLRKGDDTQMLVRTVQQALPAAA
jgi:two-component system, OmpR family, KDP operon response regulator KdpE